MAFLGPFGSAERSLLSRFEYWLACMLGGGLIGIAIDAPVRRWVGNFWLRLVTVSVLMTPPVTVLVGLVNHWLAGMHLSLANLGTPWFQVFIVCFAAMALRQLAWAEPVVMALQPPADEDPAATFRQRLSAKRRAAGLIAVEAEDHYLRVHTDAGSELITARFADAVAELAGRRRRHRGGEVAARPWRGAPQVRTRRPDQPQPSGDAARGGMVLSFQRGGQDRGLTDATDTPL
jgi:hypothetical protein